MKLWNGYFGLRIPALVLVVAAAGSFAQAAITVTISGPTALESGEPCLFSAAVAGTGPQPELEWSVTEGTTAVDCWLNCHDGEIIFAPPQGEGIRRFTVQAKCGETIATHGIQVGTLVPSGEGGVGGTAATKRLRASGPSPLTSSLSLTSSSSSSSSSLHSLPLLPAMHPEGGTAWDLTPPGPTQYLTKLPGDLLIHVGGYLSEKDALGLLTTGRHFSDPVLKRPTITDIRTSNKSYVDIDFSKPQRRNLFGYRNLSVRNLDPDNLSELDTAVDLIRLEFVAGNHNLSDIYSLFFRPKLEQLTLIGGISNGASLEDEKSIIEGLRDKWHSSSLEHLQLGEYGLYGIKEDMNFDLAHILDKLPLKIFDMGACYIGQGNCLFRANLVKALPSLAETLEDFTINTEGVTSAEFIKLANALNTLKSLKCLSIIDREGNDLTSDDFGRLGLALSNTKLENLAFSIQECPDDMDSSYLLNLPPTVTELEGALVGDADNPENIDTVITALGRLPLLASFSNECNSNLTAHGAIRIANFLVNRDSIKSVDIIVNDADGLGEGDPEVDEQIKSLKKAFTDANKHLNISFN
ncbi:MAG: hypothetical protein P4L36_14435 [Holophaga sp.]|nr:hypothetical protein [Holophaga sp.]